MSWADKTKLGIAKARSRGVVWGRHGAVLAARNKAEAQQYAETLVPLLLQLEEARPLHHPRFGPRRLARKLNELGVPGRNGGVWHPATVARLHLAPPAVRGPAVVEITVSQSTSGAISGTAELTPRQVRALEDNSLYIQIHSEKAPDGNLWGWLLPPEVTR